MKKRECPYCHQMVSIKNCLKYILRGTNYSTRCNHCGRELWLVKEPVSFIKCVWAGFLTGYFSVMFCIYFCDMDYVSSLVYCLPLFVILIIAVIILTMKRIEFKK